MNTMIALENLTKEYGMGDSKVVALQSINLEISEGESIAITGASGSGKTTLLRMIGMLDQPTTGSIKYQEMDMSNQSDKVLSKFRNRTVGFIYQDFHLIPELNAEENICLPLLIAKEKRDERYIDELMNVFGIAERKKHLPSQLSGGQQQRVAIARALVCKPKLLLCDEPTGNLDSRNSLEVIEYLKKINQVYGTTILLITHNMDLAKQMKRQIVLTDGEINKQL